MSVSRHWLEADELPKCQHCPNLADERSFMCEDHAHEADTEVETLTEQLEGAVVVDDAALDRAEQWMLTEMHEGLSNRACVEAIVAALRGQ